MVVVCTLQVQASDPGCADSEPGESVDGTPLVYSISTAASLPVAVGRRSGDVCLSTSLNYDAAHEHVFNVTATDQGHLHLTFSIKQVPAAARMAEWLACWTQARKGLGSNCSCRVTVLGKLFTPVVSLFTKQQNW